MSSITYGFSVPNQDDSLSGVRVDECNRAKSVGGQVSHRTLLRHELK